MGPCGHRGRKHVHQTVTPHSILRSPHSIFAVRFFWGVMLHLMGTPPSYAIKSTYCMWLPWCYFPSPRHRNRCTVFLGRDGFGHGARLGRDGFVHGARLSGARLTGQERRRTRNHPGPDGPTPLRLPSCRLFNVTSTFDENLYTTPLDTGSLSRAQMAHAERMAAEIEGKTSGNIHIREERNMVRGSGNGTSGAGRGGKRT